MTDHGFIYAIKALREPYVKIGLAVNPPQRIRNLQQGSPFRLQIAQTWKVDNMKAAEDLAHAAMEKYNRGRHEDNPYETEWFDLPEGGLDEVDKTVSQAMAGHVEKTEKFPAEK